MGSRVWGLGCRVQGFKALGFSVQAFRAEMTVTNHRGVSWISDVWWGVCRR